MPKRLTLILIQSVLTFRSFSLKPFTSLFSSSSLAKVRLSSPSLAILSSTAFSLLTRSSRLNKKLSTLRMTKELDRREAVALNRADFEVSVPLMSLKIHAKDSSEYMKLFKEYSWQQPKMKRILEVPGDPSSRLFLLAAEINDPDLTGLPEHLKAFLQDRKTITVPYTMKLGYEHLAVDEVLKKVLPPGIEIPSSFEQAGHIAHLNLRPETLPYKAIIGQVILDKNPGIKTVVNKLGNIASEFRTFPMELLAGKDDYVVTLKESNASFTFNFCEVYWNSRLQTEHLRLIDLIKHVNIKRPGGVADMMAGVGPFAVPLAKEGCTVYANDLNPASYKYLKNNSEKNHCGKFLAPFNMDGRLFIMDLQASAIDFNHVIMNLPQNATDFLDVFVGFSTRRETQSSTLPTIHVYGFSSADDPILDLASRAASSMGCSLADLGAGVVSTASLGIIGVSGLRELELVYDAIYDRQLVVGHLVRDVAPKKLMVCLSFVLPAVVANATAIIRYREHRKRKLDSVVDDREGS